MTKEQLFEQIRKKKSFLSVGLDTDISKIPECVKQANPEHPVFEFNKIIVDATASYAVVYKLNVAFYESLGSIGWFDLEETIKYIRRKYPEIFIITDAKVGDIGNTGKLYAKTFFETLDADAVTVAPYMGFDSVDPFLEYPNKWAIILALTSNDGSSDFQTELMATGRQLFETVIRKSLLWENCSPENTMYVVGATKAEMLGSIRKIMPEHFLLVPGVGEQGGSLEDVAKYGINKQCGLLVNNSRGIIYASNDRDFAEVAGQKAAEMQQQMEQILFKAGLLAEE